MPEVDQIEELLADCSVDIGEPVKRRERAIELVRLGMSVPDLQLLVDYALKAKRGDVLRAGEVLAKRLASPEAWRPLVADYRRVVDAQKVRAVAERSEAAGYPRRPPPTPEWAEQDLARQAFCRVVGDRHARADVARDLSITLDRLDELVERGSRLQETYRA